MQKLAKKSREEAEKILNEWIDAHELEIPEAETQREKIIRYRENGREIEEKESVFAGYQRGDAPFRSRMIQGIISGRIFLSLDSPEIEIVLKKPLRYRENGEDKTAEILALQPETARVGELRRVRSKLFSGKSEPDSETLIALFSPLPPNAIQSISSHVDEENGAVCGVYLLFL